MESTHKSRATKAFCNHIKLQIPGVPSGPLHGLTFAAKDNFDVEGQICCYGNPDWLKTHEPAVETAWAIAKLLGAGASLEGKTITDELAFSLNGQNYHYGTPRNAVSPDRVPGGSSSGSASAVGNGDVNFALGSDTGGSVRVPAAFNEVFGFRPTHGAISVAGVLPLARSFDTVGWFAQTATLLRKVGNELLPADRSGIALGRAILAADAFEIADPAVASTIRAAAGTIRGFIAVMGEMPVAESLGGLSEWLRCFRRNQLREIWQEHGRWIENVKPKFGPEIKQRFELARTVAASEEGDDRARRRQISLHMSEWLGDDTVLVLPTVATIAPSLKSSPEELASFRDRTLALTSIASLARLPQVQIPVGRVEGGAVGLSIIGPRGSDRDLLALAELFADAIP